MRAGLGGTRVRVEADPTDVRRTLADVLALLDRADAAVREPAAAVFRALAEAEARVHRMPVGAGALPRGRRAGQHRRRRRRGRRVRLVRLDRLVCSQIALGGGRADTAHGPIPVPGPAVIELLRGHDAPGVGGPVETELATPTGVALAVTLADGFGPLPGLRPELVGVGAGERDPVGHANITRLVVGAAGETGGAADLTGRTRARTRRPSSWRPTSTISTRGCGQRCWPTLLDAGASDAWLTPILMKKGRPAHTLSVLTAPELHRRARADGLHRHHHDRVATAAGHQTGTPPGDDHGRGPRSSGAGQARPSRRRGGQRRSRVRRRGRRCRRRGGAGRGDAGRGPASSYGSGSASVPPGPQPLAGVRRGGGRRRLLPDPSPGSDVRPRGIGGRSDGGATPRLPPGGAVLVE